MKGFFMIFLEDGNSPTFKHLKYADALLEAKRLAKLTGKAAHVLASYKKVELNEFIIETNISDEVDTLPF